jgi:K(+)-stimulated pyrophosphate-energized sodium pump
MDVFYAIVVGLVVGTLMSIITEYYTAMGKRPVNSIIEKSGTGHATNIIGGLAVGMESTVLPILVLAAGIIFSYAFAGIYGVSIAAAGMMATTAMQLAIDAFGPIADNAGGIAEMSQLPPEVRERTDNLDAVGNTTAATGKGFAIASAALTSLALFAAFVGISGISAIDIYKAPVLAGLFVGGMIPFIFSALCISAVGKAAMEMVNEVRRQFREIPGIMEYKAQPEYEKCVEISTKASIKQMILPGAIALLVPVLVGFGFKGVFETTSSAEILGGLLAGVTVSGVLMGIFQSNAGGAWDNAKKSFEKGVLIDGKTYKKGSEPHKAAVTGDTVGDPFKDTSGPSMNILIKLMSIVSLVIAPYIAVQKNMAVASEVTTEVVATETLSKELSTGVSLSFAQGGIEDQMIKFIESSDSLAGKENWFNFVNLNFSTGSDKLDSTSLLEVNNISEIMKAFPAVAIKLGGYTDNVGAAASNLELSSKRAAAVKAALVALGTDAARLESEGYGDQHPAASNDTEEGRAQNRRIAVSVRKK